jgi:hypothetical protein
VDVKSRDSHVGVWLRTNRNSQTAEADDQAQAQANASAEASLDFNAEALAGNCLASRSKSL